MAEIKTVAVIGGGMMGRSIAHGAALGGYRTILEDILPASLRKAESEIRGNLKRAVELGQLSHADAHLVLVRLEYAGTVEEAARQADLVIEAVPDEMESKLEIVTLLDKICKPNTILVCTTSSLSVTEIASVTYRAGKILGMRFAIPFTEQRRLEIVRTPETDDATVSACVEVGRRLGMDVAVVQDAVSK
jgi:3-hydroxybutyryl-CoA dehydrogenase